MTPDEAREQRRFNPSGGPKPPWWTGTIEDQFTPVYMAMAQKSLLHDTIPPREVDAMDLTTIWALMGIGKAKQMRSEQVDMVRASDPSKAMVPLTDEEKAARLAAAKARPRVRRVRTDTRG